MLYSSAFDMEREREWRQRENALKVQIAQLEATLKADLGEKGGILDKLAVEKGIVKNLVSQIFCCLQLASGSLNQFFNIQLHFCPESMLTIEY